jgi:hypothetical protein
MISHLWHTFVVLVQTPFTHSALIWGIVPLYFAWLLNELTSSKASFRTAVQTGFTLLWAAAQWASQYVHRPLLAPRISVNGMLAVNMFVTLLVIVVGVLALVSGLRRKFPRYCKFLGHTRFSAYFMIAIFPIQAHYLVWTWDRLISILVFAVPVWLIVHFGFAPLRQR